MAVHPSGRRVNSTCVSSLTLELCDKISPRDVSAARLEAGGKKESREARESKLLQKEGQHGQLRKSGLLTGQNTNALGCSTASPVLRNCQRQPVLLGEGADPAD